MYEKPPFSGMGLMGNLTGFACIVFNDINQFVITRFYYSSIIMITKAYDSFNIVYIYISFINNTFNVQLHVQILVKYIE